MRILFNVARALLAREQTMKRNFSFTRNAMLTGSAILVSMSACRDQTGVRTTFASVDKDWVTPAIAAQLDRDQRFPGARPDITTIPAVALSDARTLADAYVKTFGHISASIWSDDAGVTVTPDQLVQCDRIDFVESAYEEIPADRSQLFRNAWGSHWLVRFCQNGSAPVVEVSVAASAAKIIVTRDGRIAMQSLDAAFNDHGVAQNSKRYPSVEDGARHVATSNLRPGALIAALPRLVHAGRGTAPWVDSWIFTQLDGAAVRSRVSVFGASKSSLITRPVAETTAESDTLLDVAPVQGGASIPVVVKRRAEALQVTDVLLFLSQPRG